MCSNDQWQCCYLYVYFVVLLKYVFLAQCVSVHWYQSPLDDDDDDDDDEDDDYNDDNI